MGYDAYVDDSKDRHAEKVVVSGIFIGDKQGWSSFQTRWQKRLDKEGMRYFKASEYYGLRGEFARFQSESNYPRPTGREAAKIVFDDLEEIINHAAIASMGVVIPVQDFNDVLSDPRAHGLLPTDPYTLALNIGFYTTIKELNKDPGKHVVTFIHDGDDRFPQYRTCYDRFKEKNPRTAKQICGFMSMDDQKHPPLQAADLAANVTCNFAKEWLDNNRNAGSLTRLKGSMHNIVVATKEYLLDYLDFISARDANRKSSARS